MKKTLFSLFLLYTALCSAVNAQADYISKQGAVTAQKFKEFSYAIDNSVCMSTRDTVSLEVPWWSSTDTVSGESLLWGRDKMVLSKKDSTQYVSLSRDGIFALHLDSLTEKKSSIKGNIEGYIITVSSEELMAVELFEAFLKRKGCKIAPFIKSDKL